MTPIRNAFCLPGTRINRRTTGFGFYGPEGQVLANTAIRTSIWQTDPPPNALPPRESTRLFGPALFAGSVDKQFGFILLNALGRLWALEHLPPETTLVYAAKPQARPPSFAVLPAILASLGLSHRILVTETAMSFDALYTAEERFGEVFDGRGCPEFYDWLDTRWPASAPPDPDNRLYVTRSGLGPAAGRYACEDHLEALLAAEGYRIFAPEAHSIAEQIAAFQAAGRLIFAEGSALHLFALLRRPGQISAVIHRREALPEVMQVQMADRPGTPTLAINAVSELWWPPQRGDHLGLSVLDFDLLGQALRASGLIEGAGWRAPDKAAEMHSLQLGLAPNEKLMTGAERAKWLKALRARKG